MAGIGGKVTNIEGGTHAIRVPYGKFVLNMVWCTYGIRHPRFVIVPEESRFSENDREYIKKILLMIKNKKFSFVKKLLIPQCKVKTKLVKMEYDVDILGVKLARSIPASWFVRHNETIVDGPFDDEKMAADRAAERIEESVGSRRSP